MARRPDSKMLSGLRSRCTIPAACAWPSASATWPPMSATRGQGRRVCRLISARRDGPATNSITIQGAPSCSTTSWIVMTPGWASRAAARASRSARATSPARSAGCCGGSRSSLTATIRSSNSSCPRHTRPRPPCPTGSPSTYRPPTKIPASPGIQEILEEQLARIRRNGLRPVVSVHNALSHPDARIKPMRPCRSPAVRYGCLPRINPPGRAVTPGGVLQDNAGFIGGIAVIGERAPGSCRGLVLPVTEMSDEGGVQGADVGMFEGPAAGVAVGPWW